MPFKIGVIGCGRHATRVHGPSHVRYAKETPDTQLAFACDIDLLKAQAYAQAFGFSDAGTDFDALIKTHRPDALVLVAPVDAACEMGQRVLAHAIPTLMEKPPGKDPAELAKLIKAAGATPVTIAFNRRFSPVIVKTRELAQSAIDANTLQSVSYEFIRCGRNEEDFSTTAIHAIDATEYLAGSPFQSAHMAYQYGLGDEEPPTVLWVWGSLLSGALASVVCNPMAGLTSERISIQAHNTTILCEYPVLDRPGIKALVREHIQDATLRSWTEDDLAGPDLVERTGFYGENKAFFDATRAGKPLGPNLSDCIGSVGIADAIRQRKTSWQAS
jgi:myo-inositol 2-dehydrogenase / D-chiro-inositol 1-dehydrogenase